MSNKIFLIELHIWGAS